MTSTDDFRPLTAAGQPAMLRNSNDPKTLYRGALWNARRANRCGMRARALFWLDRCAAIRAGLM